MSIPLYEFWDGRGEYERPTQGWVCGWAAEGKACQAGPDAAGRCRATTECLPYRQGDRWHCARSTNRGGPCPDGPRPDGGCSRPILSCQPARSLRKRRGLVVFSILALSLGVVLVGIGGTKRQPLVMPGALTFGHGSVTQDCSDCHASATDSPHSWLPAAVRTHEPMAATRLCLVCHDLDAFPTFAHGYSPEGLARKTEQARREAAPSAPLLLALAKHGPGIPRSAAGEVACALCHREHQGKQFELTAMDDRRCQACHVQQFQSLKYGHPEFAGYPYHRRTRINFDHVAHIGRHFRDFQVHMPAGIAPTSCASCHELAPSGKAQLIRGYEQTCASCHEPEIEFSVLGGVPFLELPGVDVQTLRAKAVLRRTLEPLGALAGWPGSPPVNLVLAGLVLADKGVLPPQTDIGQWPVMASAGFSPFMELLLSTDPLFVDARSRLREVDVRDLHTASNEQLAAAVQVVWSVKSLLFEIVTQGDMALRQRFVQAVGRPLTPEMLAKLTADLPVEIVQDAQKAWLPDLASEMAARRAQRVVPAAVTMPAAESKSPQPRWALWYRNDPQYTIYFRQIDHADVFLRQWLDLAGREWGAKDSFRGVFDALAYRYAPGRCTKCHSVDAQPDGARLVHWTGRRPRLDDHPFTKFGHEQHLSVVGDKHCLACHVFDPQADYEASFWSPDARLNLDPARFQSNFVAMRKAECATCHIPEEAGTSCLQCHNYHVGHFGMPPPRVPLSTSILTSGSPASSASPHP